MSQANTDITRVTLRWDDQPGVEPGWYCQAYDADGVRDDSVKTWFPIDVDDFSRGQKTELLAALRDAFPAADIVEE